MAAVKKIFWASLCLFPGFAHAGPVSPHERLGQLIGSRPAVVNFWASWCEPCREELPALQKFAESADGKNIAVITVAVRDWHARTYLETHALHLHVVEDRENVVGRYWKVHMLPTTLILDRRHRIRLRRLGAVDWNSRAFLNKIQALLK